MINKVILKVQEFRDVYATCIKSLVNEVPHDYFEAIKPVLEISIKGIYIYLYITMQIQIFSFLLK